MPPTQGEHRSQVSDVVQLAAVDPGFFCRHFFPDTFRTDNPAYQQDLWHLWEAPENRYTMALIFRAGAKTTNCRAFTAKRIAYGLSRTILYIGASSDHAARSIDWITDQIKNNRKFANTFGLRMGEKDTGTDIEIYHGTDKFPIRVLGMGITGRVRGINIRDHRPDLIVMDDVMDDENAITQDARNKIKRRIMGAVLRSLASAEDNQDARIVGLQTPIEVDDFTQDVVRDPQWHTLEVSCFNERGHSIWPSQYPTEVLQADKASYIRMNMLSVWLKEMEVTVTADESRYFRREWLLPYETLPEHPRYALGVDPSPPKDEEPEKRSKKDPDPESITLVAQWGTKVFFVRGHLERNPDPEKTWQTLKSWAMTVPIVGCGIETTAYQKTLKWYIEKRRIEDGFFLHIVEITSTVAKTKRLRQRFVSMAPGSSSPFKIYIDERSEGAPEFISKFVDYPAVTHDDELDSFDIACRTLEMVVGAGMNRGDEPSMMQAPRSRNFGRRAI